MVFWLSIRSKLIDKETKILSGVWVNLLDRVKTKDYRDKTRKSYYRKTIMNNNTLLCYKL